MYDVRIRPYYGKFVVVSGLKADFQPHSGVA